MTYLILIVLSLALLGVALFYFLRSNELRLQILQSEREWQEREDAYSSELTKLEKLRHIPGVIEKAGRTKQEIETKLAQAQKRADEIVLRATLEAQEHSRRLRAESERDVAEARESLRVAQVQA